MGNGKLYQNFIEFNTIEFSTFLCYIKFYLSFTLDTNSSFKITQSSPKIESLCQLNKQKLNEEIEINDEKAVEATSKQKEFIIEEFDMIHLLCKISQGCFPEPRVIFYNKQGKRMQNNENVKIGE